MFQSTPPRGGRHLRQPDRRRLSQFQSTPPRGGRHALNAKTHQRTSFNPRPRVGGDCRIATCGCDLTFYCIFASRAFLALPAMSSNCVFQFSPPCSGGLRTSRPFSVRLGFAPPIFQLEFTLHQQKIPLISPPVNYTISGPS